MKAEKIAGCACLGGAAGALASNAAQRLARRCGNFAQALGALLRGGIGGGFVVRPRYQCIDRQNHEVIDRRGDDYEGDYRVQEIAI